MAKRIMITGRTETLLQRLVAQFRRDNMELEGAMSDGKAASLIVKALITWAYKDEIVFGMDPKGGLHMMIPKEKVEALQEVIILRQPERMWHVLFQQTEERGWSRDKVIEKGIYYCLAWERLDVFAKRGQN